MAVGGDDLSDSDRVFVESAVEEPCNLVSGKAWACRSVLASLTWRVYSGSSNLPHLPTWFDKTDRKEERCEKEKKNRVAPF